MNYTDEIKNLFEEIIISFNADPYDEYTSSDLFDEMEELAEQLDDKTAIKEWIKGYTLNDNEEWIRENALWTID
ncbi:hypothetical protein B8A42_08380 [Dolosigranulum pigrum]|uniref:Uncharacterized protein n=1 Tax=Dolosigranulum pigrum TaxID=29394 RepID=A0A328K7J6_9LACT|nr:hypothetical protein [Dolosigranulum pigrum]QDO92130.1 hypothetical protein FNV33_09045 [Dolosigranulum pigrum]QDO92195.1 hypothetical protein FNV33_09400 [Dolosigranulum pigrum]QDO92260.1 hypothetical protein FNV33_09755 [Dolosigranulum pigrum]RAN53737.1 hypothetical protein B8A42_08380 [Dolosigranulum pigrum]